MTLSLDELRLFRDSLDSSTSLEDLDVDPHPLSIPKTFPSADDITVLTFNFWDNGESVKSKWVSSRYVMNLQVFTLDTPFAPTAAVAAWTGAIQLFGTSFVGRYLTSRHPDHEPIARPILAETDKLAETYNDVLIGQVYSKSGGTHYEWGTMLRTYTDDLAEFGADLIHEGQTIRAQDFTTITDPKRPKLKMVGKYDPRGLWQSKVRKPRTAKKAPRP